MATLRKPNVLVHIFRHTFPQVGLRYGGTSIRISGDSPGQILLRMKPTLKYPIMRDRKTKPIISGIKACIIPIWAAQGINTPNNAIIMNRCFLVSSGRQAIHPGTLQPKERMVGTMA